MKIFKKILKIASIIILSIVILIVLGIAALLIYNDQKVKITKGIDYLETQPYVWNEIVMEPDCKCSDGSPFSILVKKGNSENLIIYFSGGGVCWDDHSCTTPISLFNLDGYYFPDINKGLLKVILHGILDNDNDKNPFKDWNIVYIPYCTADFHIGDTINTYTDSRNKSRKVYHYGQKNVSAALDYIFETFHKPSKIFITGESAGGFGNIFWTQPIVKHYGKTKAYQLSDCSLINAPIWPRAAKLWNARTDSVFGFEINENIVPDALLNTSRILKDYDITFLQSFSLYDDVLVKFYARTNNLSMDNRQYIEDWNKSMINSVKMENDSLPNYNFFISGCNPNENGLTPHTFEWNDQFYNCISDDLSFQQWLKKCVIDDQGISKGEKYIE